MNKAEFLQRLQEDDEYPPGWQAIEDAFAALYPGQEPEHFATNVASRAMFGGNQYLDGYSVYTSPKGFKHLVTFGMTVLYGSEASFGGTWARSQPSRHS